MNEKDELAAYLAGQQPFLADSANIEPSEEILQIQRLCARCYKPCKAQYKHCYRCHNYLKVKARIA